MPNLTYPQCGFNKVTVAHFFHKNTIIFAEPQYPQFFTGLSLNLFLKYSYSSKCFTINCNRKISHQKNLHFKQNKTYIEQSEDIFD